MRRGYVEARAQNARGKLLVKSSAQSNFGNLNVTVWRRRCRALNTIVNFSDFAVPRGGWCAGAGLQPALVRHGRGADAARRRDDPSAARARLCRLRAARDAQACAPARAHAPMLISPSVALHSAPLTAPRPAARARAQRGCATTGPTRPIRTTGRPSSASVVFPWLV